MWDSIRKLSVNKRFRQVCFFTGASCWVYFLSIMNTHPVEGCAGSLLGLTVGVLSIGSVFTND